MYESHITVQGLSKDTFLEICKRINVKPIIINERSEFQYMTGKFHKGTLEETIEEMHAIELSFPANSVIRSKLELIVGKNPNWKNHFYFYQEFHSKFDVPAERKKDFEESALALDCTTSTNELKDSNHIFLTSRDKSTQEVALATLAGKMYKHLGTIQECVVLDTNPFLDRGYASECMQCPLKKL